MAAAETLIGLRQVNHWVAGRILESKSDRSGAVWNPTTGEEQARAVFADIADVDAAVAAAREAFPAWRETALSRRAEILFRLRDLVDRNRRKIA
jgi:malonate-semialdehyde dehydrogenase (acetylating) / methylmalonate-semialdehyde dehydrogenase